ncbi:HEPN domain-containing protein [Macrococcoides bohemicum]|uniref:Uncharacterized protein n=1 Tax=Macrococcoides bohemicum TaxID=1903056 RepID=A0A327ZZI6_9STAP|nr:HEPN domain-containing protein [Macrococcus bohemicus]RAK47690.1 hypothetical protein BHX94_12605 [Macrococcus bohemicus]
MNIYIFRLDNLKLLNNSPISIIPREVEHAEGFVGSINKLEEKYKKLIKTCLNKSQQLSVNQKELILKKPSFIFLYSSNDTNIQSNNKRQLDIFYANKHRILQELIAAFSIALWIIKDNALNFNQSYHCDLRNGYEATIGYDLKNVCSNGLISSASFNNEEIHYALDLMYTIHEFMKKSVDSIDIYNYDNNGTTFYSNEEFISQEFTKDNTYSFSRALIYLQSARSTGFLTKKISQYSACLECIFAIKENHSKNLSEITSNLLSSNTSEKDKISMDMKDVYSVRSDQEHGGQIKYLKNHSQRNLIELSQRLDDYVRKVIKYIIRNPELNYQMGDVEKKSATRLHFKAMIK